MFSVTEERLRNFVEKLSEALTNEVRVEVRPGDSWAAYPKRNPPLLTFRLADVATIRDEILGVTAHEIAHLLYTDPETKIPFDVGKFPRAAQLLLNAVEDSRIERVFSDDFPGARSLFDRKVDEAYDGKVQRGFAELPIKWRFILNIDRVLHGLEPWGDERDVNAVEVVFDHVVAAMWTDSTQECADGLEFPFRVMVQLMKLEDAEKGGNVPQHLDIPPELLEQIMAERPPDYIPNAPEDDPMDDDGGYSEHANPSSGQDDHQQGGTDGSDGRRAGGRGLGAGSGEGKTGAGKGGGGGKGGSRHGAGSNLDWHGFGDPNDKGSGGIADDPSGAALPDDKPTNIVEEMVAEERAKGNTNRTVDILSYRQRQRAQQAKEVERKIEQEKNDFWEELNKLFGHNEARSKRVAERMLKNQVVYERDRTALDVEIRTLRGYARQILRDNQTERYGGNHTSGLKIKKHRLYRMVNNDPRVFERKEEIGGRSYAICVVVDQSSSMRSGDKQQLAYLSALVFLEAFEGLAETSVVGFSEASGDDAYAAARGGGRGRFNRAEEMARRDLFYARTYKSHDNELTRRTMMVPELAISYSSTPMTEGVRRGIAELAKSTQDVKAMVVITDGQPNDGHSAAIAFKQAKRAGIETYALHIEGRHGMDSPVLAPGLAYLGSVVDRVSEVHTTTEIPQAVNRLLRGVVRRGRAVA